MKTRGFHFRPSCITLSMFYWHETKPQNVTFGTLSPSYQTKEGTVLILCRRPYSMHQSGKTVPSRLLTHDQKLAPFRNFDETAPALYQSRTHKHLTKRGNHKPTNAHRVVWWLGSHVVRAKDINVTDLHKQIIRFLERTWYHGYSSYKLLRSTMFSDV